MIPKTVSTPWSPRLVTVIVAAAISALVPARRRRSRSLAILLAIGAYTLFAGASPSVLRAALMAGVVLLARLGGRAGPAAAALGIAAAMLLLVDPAMVADAGFQLSVAATAGLLAWATPLRARLDHLARGHAPSWLAETLALSLAALTVLGAADMLSVYVRQMLVNAAADRWRRLRYRREEPLAPDSAAVAAGDEAGEAADRDVMLRALATLPPRQRAGLVLRYFEALSELQTAAILGCGVGTVKSQSSRALARLREITMPPRAGQPAGQQPGAITTPQPAKP